MYFVVNGTQQQIIISDLKLNLGPKQATDLDIHFGREQLERSRNLKSLIAEGKIQVKRKDDVNKVVPQIIEKESSNIDVDKMKKEISDVVKDTISKSMPQQQPFNMEELIKTLSEMMKNNNTGQPSIKINTEQEVEMDDKILADMHSRVVEKIVKDVKTSDISYIEGKGEAENINKNVSELEGLL